MTETANKVVTDLELVENMLERISADLGMIIDREFKISSATVERADKRAEGRSKIHISFKLCFKSKGESLHGCALMPLPDAISLAAYLMMVPDDAVKTHRSTTNLDRSTKDAMLEVGNFVGGATDAVVRSWFSDKISVRSQGCQGVRANVRPAFPRTEGEELILGRATARIHDFPEFEIILMLPVLPGM